MQRSFLRVLAVFLLAVVWPAFANAMGNDNTHMHGAIEIPDTPLDVAVAIELEQITSVDQKSENYGAVATIRMAWQDPLMAFDPDEAGGEVMILGVQAYVELARERNAIVPSFAIQNQQGNRWAQNEMIVVYPDGSVRYLEKSSLTLQAPYFNFTRYPFDRQVFYFEIVSHFPERVVRYSAGEDLSGLGSMLGEEEWILSNPSMEISQARGLSGQTSSKAALRFEGRRHTQYYLTRIFLPLLVLVAVSWSVFFLDGYRKRAEVAGANLLVFVAFNWVISDELPKLGYLTFLDFILQWMFVVTGLIVVVNVFLSRLKANGRESTAITLDWYLFRWVYPLGYVGIVIFGIWHYLLRH